MESVNKLQSISNLGVVVGIIIIIWLLPRLITVIPSRIIRIEKGYDWGITNALTAFLFGFIYFLYVIGLPISEEKRLDDIQYQAKLIAKAMAKELDKHTDTNR